MFDVQVERRFGNEIAIVKTNYPAFKSLVRAEPEPETPRWQKTARIVAAIAAVMTCVILTLWERGSLLDGDGGSPGGALLVAIGGPVFILSLAAILGAAAYGVCALLAMLAMRRRK